MSTANSPESNFNKLEGLKGDQSLDKKLQNLVKQIDELRDTDSGNDAIDWVFDKKIGWAFDKWLSKALNKCDIFVIDNLLAAIKEVKAFIGTDSEEWNSLTRLENWLTRLKENREKTQESTFRRFDGWVKVLASGVAENPHRKKDEISAVVDFVKNDAHNADALNLYYQIKNDIDWSKMASNFDKKTLDTVGKIMREVTNSIKNKINNDDFLNSLTIDSVKEAKLDEVFGDGNVGNLVTLLNNYLSIKNWNWENLNSDSWTWNSNDAVFSHDDFIKRFNEINTERKKDIDESIKWITIDDIDDDEMRKFLVLVWENKADKTLYYDKEEFTVSKMQEVFPDKVDGIISKWVDAEREGLLNEVFKKVSELVNDHIEKRENDEYIDINTWEMKLWSEDYRKMEAALGADKMFLKHEYRTEWEKHVDRYSYNLKKLQSFLDGVKDSNFSGLMKLSQSKNENDVYTARAAISAIQILLNREFPKNLLVVDWKYRDGGSTYNRTLDFQKKYNEWKDKSVQLRLDGKPWIKTITALLGWSVSSSNEAWKPTDESWVETSGNNTWKRYEIWVESSTWDFKFDWLWEFKDWKFITSLKEWADEKGKYVEYKDEKYYECSDNLTWKWYYSWKSKQDTGCHLFYLWEFKNWKISWEWVHVRDNWEKFEWTYDEGNGDFIKWVYTFANWVVYEWEFKNGVYEWNWTMIFLDWIKYEWNFMDGVPDWNWTMSYPNWSKVVWDWKEGVFLGWAWNIINEDWSKYVWQLWKGEIPEWNWVYTFPDWVKYEWEFKNGVYEWNWTLTFSDWSKFTWEFRNDEYHVWKWTYDWKNWNQLDWEWNADWGFVSWTFKVKGSDLEYKVKCVVDGDNDIYMVEWWDYDWKHIDLDSWTLS